MKRIASLAERIAVGGVALSTLLIAGCQSTKDETAQEPVVSARPTVAVEAPAAPAAARKRAPVNLGSDPNCAIPVTAKSQAAVADPCLTTNKFIDSIAALSQQQKTKARRLIAASDQSMAKANAHLAH